MAAVGLDPAGILCQIRAVDAARAVVLLRQVGRARMRLVFSRLPPARSAWRPVPARMRRKPRLGQVADRKARVGALADDLRRAAEADGTARRLPTIPGIGPITAGVLAAALPGVSASRSAVARGRSDRWRDPLANLPSWLGLTPNPQASGAGERLRAIPKTGNRDVRRRLCPGAMGRSRAASARIPASTGRVA
jgi:transposase